MLKGGIAKYQFFIIRVREIANTWDHYPKKKKKKTVLALTFSFDSSFR